MSHTEAEWLSAARQFDEKVLGELYETYSPELYRYAYRLIGDEQTAEDVVSETFHRFLRALQSGGGPEQYLRAYLYRIAHNLAIDHHRRGPAPSTPLEDVEHRVSEEETPEEDVLRNLTAQRVRKTLWLLTDDQRQVLLLKYYQGLNNAEVAAAVNKTVGAVKALQHRAVDSLRRIWETDEEEHHEERRDDA